MATKFSHPPYEEWEKKSADEKEAIIGSFFTDQEWIGKGRPQKTRDINIYDDFLSLVHNELPYDQPYFIKAHAKRVEAARKNHRKIAFTLPVKNGATGGGDKVQFKLPLPIRKNSSKNVAPTAHSPAISSHHTLKRQGQELTADETDLSAPKRYKLRETKRVDYAGMDDSNEVDNEPFVKPRFTEDGLENIYCYACKDYITNGCLSHPLHFVADSEAECGMDGYARISCPEGLSICKSNIEGAGMGAWNDKLLEAGTTFGPYRGMRQTSREGADQSGYSWEVETRFGDIWVDGKDERFGNWMRFVNHGFNDEPHLFAFEWKEDIFYVVLRSVPVGTELLVSYGLDYGRTLQPFNKAKRYIQDKKKRSSISGVFPCSKCAQQITYTSAELLAAHTERYHSDRQQFECPRCDKLFTQVGSRNCHVRNVHDKALEKKHKCCWCEKAFSLKWHLTRHERTHTKEKPFKCADCGTAFIQKSHLMEHKRSHSGEKPFACTQCQQKFTKSGDLQKHLRIHTGEKPYKCQYCEMRFSVSCNCRSHEQRVHKQVLRSVFQIC